MKGGLRSYADRLLQKASARVDRNAVHADLVVKMRTGALPGAADLRDLLAFAHLLSRVHVDLRQVQVLRRDPLAVVQNDRASVAVHLTRGLNGAVARSINRRPGRIGNVQTRMKLDSA